MDSLVLCGESVVADPTVLARTSRALHLCYIATRSIKRAKVGKENGNRMEQRTDNNSMTPVENDIP